MLIGYARVSKADGSQSLDLQRDALRAEGVDAVNVYHDFASGVRDDRPGLDSCVRALRKGDVLVVWKLDRLGRNLAHLVTPRRTCRPGGVGLRVLTGQGAQIDTTTAAGRLVFGIFAALAEFEQELITVRPSASVSMRPSVAPGLRPWSRFAKVSANASAPSATGSPAGCVFATTTARTTWLTISNRRSRSSGLRVPRASCESPKAMGSRSVSSARERRISCGCGASKRSRNSASPCSSFNGRTTSSGCWRSTTIGVQPKCDAISTGWTR